MGWYHQVSLAERNALLNAGQLSPLMLPHQVGHQNSHRRTILESAGIHRQLEPLNRYLQLLCSSRCGKGAGDRLVLLGFWLVPSLNGYCYRSCCFQYLIGLGETAITSDRGRQQR